MPLERNRSYSVLETGHYSSVQTPELYARTISEFLDAVGV